MTSLTLFNSLSRHPFHSPFLRLKTTLAPLILGAAIVLAGIVAPHKPLPLITSPVFDQITLSR